MLKLLVIRKSGGGGADRLKLSGFAPRFLTLCLLFFTPPAIAADTSSKFSSPSAKIEATNTAPDKTATVTPLSADPKQTEILVNKMDGTVRILIKGKEILSVDDKGIKVHGNIDYTGAISDTK